MTYKIMLLSLASIHLKFWVCLLCFILLFFFLLYSLFFVVPLSQEKFMSVKCFLEGVSLPYYEGP